MLGRLAQTKDDATDVAIETYAYDATGNRTALTTAAGTASYTYPADSHRLLAIDGEARNHDATGNPMSVGGKAFSYSDANRMSAVKQAGAVVESYTYNHRGERVLRAPVSADAQVTVYDEAGQWIGNYGAAGQPLQQAIWLDNYPVALINAPRAGVPEVAYVQPDHLGTPRVVIDPVRDVAIWEWSSKSEVFGNQVPNADADGDGVAFELALRFPGQQATDASGMFYNYQRDYDPVVGRYSQSDPIGLAGGISTFAYVQGSPTIGVDSLGLQSSATRHALSRALATSTTPDGYQRWDPENPNYEGAGAPGPYIYPDRLLLPALEAAIWMTTSLAVKGDPRALLQLSKRKSDRGSKPDGCPVGTLPIDSVKGKYGWSGEDLHKIKEGAFSGPEDWTGIDGDGHVWTHGEDGFAEDQGHFGTYLPKNKGAR